MTPDQLSDLDLFRRYRDTGDLRAREELVQRFLPLARQLASRYRRTSEPFEDLVQVASFGLLKAIDGFDPAREVAFSTYAVPTIAGELKRHFRDRTWSVRVPRSLQELVLRVEREAESLSRKLGRSPSVPELAKAAGVSEEDVLEALQARTAYGTESLDAPHRGGDGDDVALGDSIGSADRGFAAAEDAATLAGLLAVLDDRQREVLRLRFEEDLTQSEIGERIGVSQMQISRIIRQAIATLQLHASAHPAEGEAARRGA